MTFSALARESAHVTRILAAIANEKRLLILLLLLEGERNVGEIAEAVELGQSPLSQHLSKLRAQGIVATRREGQLIYYRLVSEEVAKILETLKVVYRTA